MIDSTAYARLNVEEKEKVDTGKVLINHDPVTGRSVIRVWIRCKMQEFQQIGDNSIPFCHDSSKGFR